MLVVDTSQTAGMLPIDIMALGADVLCFTSHKGLMGAQGTGGLCIRPGMDIRPLLTGGSGVQHRGGDRCCHRRGEGTGAEIINSR